MGVRTMTEVSKWFRSMLKLNAAAVGLYRNRGDKDWSLTDCLSITVMERRQLTEALTTDHHFEQAGVTALVLCVLSF